MPACPGNVRAPDFQPGVIYMNPPPYAFRARKDTIVHRKITQQFLIGSTANLGHFLHSSAPDCIRRKKMMDNQYSTELSTIGFLCSLIIKWGKKGKHSKLQIVYIIHKILERFFFLNAPIAWYHSAVKIQKSNCFVHRTCLLTWWRRPTSSPEPYKNCNH